MNQRRTRRHRRGSHMLLLLIFFFIPIASCTENVYISSSYGQLVSSSTLRWKPVSSSSSNPSFVHLDPTVVRVAGERGSPACCRGYHQDQLLPGNTDHRGRCGVGFFGRVHHLESYQVLVDPGSTARLEWLKWDIFTKRPIGMVAFLEEDGFIARVEERFGDLNPRRGLSGDIAIYYAEDDKVQYFTEGEILVEIEPVRYKLEDIEFVTRRAKVHSEELHLGSRILANDDDVEGEGGKEDSRLSPPRPSLQWDSVRAVIAYNASYNYYWGQFPGMLKGLPANSQSFGHAKKISFEWGLPLSFTRHRILEVSFQLSPATSVQVSASAYRTTTEVPYSATLVSVYADGKERKKVINGTYLETLLSEVTTEYGRPYFTQNGTFAPTTTTTTTSTTSTTTTTLPPWMPPPRPTTPHLSRRTTTSTTPEAPPAVPPSLNPLLRFYPSQSNEESNEVDVMQSDQATAAKRSTKTGIAGGSGNGNNGLFATSGGEASNIGLSCLSLVLIAVLSQTSLWEDIV